MLNAHSVVPVVAIVTRSVAHILVVGHLVLEADTTHDFVLAKVVGQVVLDVPNGVVDSIVPSEELVAECHVVVAALRDVNEGELAGIGAALVVELREGGEELVREIVGQSAVQVERERVYEVVLRVHRIGKRHRILRHTGTALARSSVHRRGVGGAPDRVFRVVVAQGEVMAVGDVPVEASQHLVVALVGGETRVGTRAVAIFAGHIVRNGLQVAHRRARDILDFVGHAVHRATPAGGNRRNLNHFGIDEEEELVLENRAAKGEAPSGLLVLVAGTAELLALDGVAAQILVLVVHIGRAAERVRTRLRDGIHATADEVGLAHVVGRNHHLQLLDSIERNGVTAAGQTAGEAEVVVEVGTVDGEVGRALVASGKGHSIAAVGRESRHVGNRAAHRRQTRNLLARDVGRGSRLLCRELGGFAADNYFTQHFRVFRDFSLQVEHFAQLKRQVGVGLLLKTYITDGNRVWPTSTHSLDSKTTVDVGHGRITRPRRRVYCQNGSTNHFLASFRGNYLAAQ